MYLNKSRFMFFLLCVFIIAYPVFIYAQNDILVWSDEFDGTEVDRSKWNFGYGYNWDNVHIYTDRVENARVADGKLQIIAREEQYQGQDYTSALIKTDYITSWRYGRVEARIKLPGSPGFVPAFWMLPADNIYGWWPASGEIDIMEFPSTEVDKIYGTVHTEAYNLFFGEPSKGTTISVPDAATAFHVYAVEWDEEKIDFYVDEQKYFTFNNEHSGWEKWPFDRPFFIIINLAVGGGWVGNPTDETVFPAVMEVDYVRVYQEVKDIDMAGPDFLLPLSHNITYSVPEIDGASYTWTLPAGVHLLYGKNSNRINVSWGHFGGSIRAKVETPAGKQTVEYPVYVLPNYIENPGFEKGVKYWGGSISHTVTGKYSIIDDGVHSGGHALLADITSLGENTWDVQVTQGNLELKSGVHYEAGFWARVDGGNKRLNAAIINPTTFFLYVFETITLTDEWTRYTMSFTAPENATAAFNIDMGVDTGRFYLDDLVFTTPELSALNLVENADFSNGDAGWTFNVFPAAQASGEVKNGEYVISIVNGGSVPWDIYLGQSGLSIANGKTYAVYFDAYAASPRDISALVGKDSDPWTVYSGEQIFLLSTNRQTYNYTFVMNEPTDNLARLGFDVGTSSADVYFDNIRICETEPNSVTQGTEHIPETVTLLQNYPNPFNPSTSIEFELTHKSLVELTVFNILGKEVVTLLNKEMNPGRHTARFDARDLGSGVYLYRLNAGHFSTIRKMVLMR
ncbi:family 16 glycosylhydrolase [candidate division KSB1 bacterium]|nr:family 16 glycosylhydrolase [candidate division KSB1 bacterium]